MTIAKHQTATQATLARVSGLSKPASAVAPLTKDEAALANKPPMTNTTSATTRFGSQRSNWRRTSLTAGKPSASNATTNTIKRTNHLAIKARKPEASVLTPNDTQTPPPIDT
jgi:hypothetical protein